MIRWIKDSIGIKNLLILVTVILVIAGLLAGPSLYKSIKRNQYKGHIEARVLNIVDKKASFQHYNGTNVKTIGYDISYTYFIDGDNYTRTEFTKSGSDVKLLYDNYSSGQNCEVVVKYSLEAPSESFISSFTKEEN